MASSGFHLWESDPLFAAAEVVQDSADRMESNFRLLLHEQSLVQGACPDEKLLSSMEYHRQELATSLETVKWQLEDFEREVSLSATSDQSQTRQIAISRHKQFIRTIKEQIAHVNKSLENTSVGNLVKNEWVNINEQDRDGLALFLSGGEAVSGVKSVEHLPHLELEDHSTMTRFLDPSSSSSFNNEIIEQKAGETTTLIMNGLENLDHTKLRSVGSHHTLQMRSEVPSTLDAPFNRHDENNSWNIKANKSKGKSCSDMNKLGGLYSRQNLLGSLSNLLSPHGRRGSRNFRKKWKDEEDQSHSLPYTSIPHAVQHQSSPFRLATAWSRYRQLWSELLTKVVYFSRWIRDCWGRYQRFSYNIKLKPRSMIFIPAILLTLLILGKQISGVEFEIAIFTNLTVKSEIPGFGVVFKVSF